MNYEFQDLVMETFVTSKLSQKIDILPLKNMITKYIKPGMHLLMGLSHSFPFAACYEILRCFHSQRDDPDFKPFTITSMGATENVNFLVQKKLVNKIITTYSGDVFPTPGPNKTYSRAMFRDNRLKIEHWSFLTLAQRLMAGAMNLEFMITNSLQGSSMALENNDTFKLIDDPFGSSKKIGLVKAINPDIAIFHAFAADPLGNLILTPPYAACPYGAMAAKGGVIATVEKIVTTDFIKKYNHLVKIPGIFVKAVSMVPLGAHPGALNSQGIEEFEAYERDYDFYVNFRKSTRSEETLNAWIKEWVLDMENHEHYLRKLGHERILYLKGKALPDAWLATIGTFIERGDISSSPKYNPIEQMIITAAHEIKNNIKTKKLNTILAGQGVSNLSAWLAYYFLKNEDYQANLLAEVGFIGYEPRPGSPFIFNFANIPTCNAITDTPMVMGVLVSGHNKCIGALGAAQIDKYGNINSTLVDDVFVLGSGGANDTTSNAQDIVVVAPAVKGRFPEKVPYISCTGEKIRTLVTTQGIFKKINNDNEFSLVSYFSDKHKETGFAEIKEIMNWDLKIAPNVVKADKPKLTELKILRLLDPRKNFIV